MSVFSVKKRADPLLLVKEEEKLLKHPLLQGRDAQKYIHDRIKLIKSKGYVEYKAELRAYILPGSCYPRNQALVHEFAVQVFKDEPVVPVITETLERRVEKVSIRQENPFQCVKHRKGKPKTSHARLAKRSIPNVKVSGTITGDNPFMMLEDSSIMFEPGPKGFVPGLHYEGDFPT